MRNTIVVDKGNRKYVFKEGQVIISAPRNIYLSEIKPCFDQLVFNNYKIYQKSVRSQSKSSSSVPSIVR